MRHTIPFHLLALSKKIQKSIGFDQLPFALSYSQAWAITIIDSQKTVSQAEIAAKLHLEAATIVTLIDELEKLNLVKRETQDTDRRKYNIVLTDEGKNCAQKIKAKIATIDKYLKQTLSEKDDEYFHSILDKLFSAIDSWEGGEKNEISSIK